MKNERLKVVVTCEHGGNEVPPEYMAGFMGAQDVLASHRGLDLGALDLYHRFTPDADFSVFSTISRLVVDLNRSLHHPNLISEYMLPLSPSKVEKVLLHHYHPYRQQVEKQVAEWIGQGFQVLHLSVHSFTPELNGKVRNADVGILYDPSRDWEQMFAARWRQQLLVDSPRYKIRYNYPYKGTADGFITHLRKHFPNEQYAGIELEVNQLFPTAAKMKWKTLQIHLTESFMRAL